MLIKRMSRALMDKELREFFVELLVVVVGVFLAIQVENWNSARKELNQEKLLLTSLHAEFVENMEIGKRSIKRFEDVEAAALQLLEISEAEEEPTMSEFYSALNNALAIRPPRLNSNTWDVLVASALFRAE